MIIEPLLFVVAGILILGCGAAAFSAFYHRVDEMSLFIRKLGFGHSETGGAGLRTRKLQVAIRVHHEKACDIVAIRLSDGR